MRKNLFVTLSLIVVLAFAGVAGAQEMDTHSDDYEFCGGLSAEDCMLLDAAAGNLPTSTAFTATFTLDVTAPEGEDGNGTLTVDASGAYMVSKEELEAAGDSLDDVAIIDFSLSNVFDVADATLSAFDAELALSATGEGEFSNPMMETISAQLWLVDGVGYVDLSPYSAMMSELDGVWGMDIFDTLAYGLEQFTVGDLLDMAKAQGFDGMDGHGRGHGEGDEMEGFQNFGQRQPQLTDEEGIAFVESFLGLERLEDTTVDGMNMAVFELSVDFEALFASDVFLRGIELNAPEEVDAEAFQQALIAGVGQDSTFTITYTIGVEDQYLYGLLVDQNYVITPSAFAEFEDDDEATPAEGTAEINITFDFNRSDINAVESINLPEDAQTITIEELIAAVVMQGMSQ